MTTAWDYPSRHPTIQVCKEADSWNGEASQFAVVGDEEINSSRRCSGQMNSVRLTDPHVGTDHAVSVGGFEVEGQNLNLFAVEELLQSIDSHKIVAFSWTRKHFANGKNACTQNVATSQHGFMRSLDPFTKGWIRF
ncbi:MAG: hypothetical protein WBD67_03030 [Terracidiphilus sp.]